jgi:hypothetical protein
MDKAANSADLTINNRKVDTWSDIIQGIKSPYNTYVFISARNSGKSKAVRNLIVELLKKVGHNHIILFSSTAYEKLNKDYEFLMKMKEAKVFPGDKKDIDENIDEVLKYCKEAKQRSEDYAAMVIFDDIDVTKKNDKVSKLFTQGRHYNLSVIVSSQNASYFLDPTKRNNIDYLAFRKVENTYKETLWKMCNIDLSSKEFNKFIKENTEDYKFILYDNTSQGKEDQDKLKVVKAFLYKSIVIKK